MFGTLVVTQSDPFDAKWLPIGLNSASLSLYGVMDLLEHYPWLAVWIQIEVQLADFQIRPSMSMTLLRTVLMFRQPDHHQTGLPRRESIFQTARWSALH